MGNSLQHVHTLDIKALPQERINFFILIKVIPINKQEIEQLKKNSNKGKCIPINRQEINHFFNSMIMTYCPVNQHEINPFLILILKYAFQ